VQQGVCVQQYQISTDQIQQRCTLRSVHYMYLLLLWDTVWLRVLLSLYLTFRLPGTPCWSLVLPSPILLPVSLSSCLLLPLVSLLVLVLVPVLELSLFLLLTALLLVALAPLVLVLLLSSLAITSHSRVWKQEISREMTPLTTAGVTCQCIVLAVITMQRTASQSYPPASLDRAPQYKMLERDMGMGMVCVAYRATAPRSLHDTEAGHL
jgi:hypothetical protein